MINDLPSMIPAIVAVVGLGFLPFIVVMGTSFTKIVVVLMLLRTALGVQTAPSGLVINSIALTLTAFILAPLGNELAGELRGLDLDISSWEEVEAIYNLIAGTFSQYLLKFAGKEEIEYFMSAAYKIWPEDMHGYVKEENFLILLPAHIVTELTKAFQIAFLIFLPFVVIDMIVSNILLALGAMMMPPTLVSLPIKILLFVAADGWNKLLNALILSYV